jgi:hypothetical protein
MFKEFSPFTITEQGITLNIKVTPKSSSNRIGKLDTSNRLKVYVTAVPENGKANEAVIALLAKHWGLSKSQIRIIRGATDSHKLIEISGNESELEERLLCGLG